MRESERRGVCASLRSLQNSLELTAVRWCGVSNVREWLRAGILMPENVRSLRIHGWTLI